MYYFDYSKITNEHPSEAVEFKKIIFDEVKKNFVEFFDVEGSDFLASFNIALFYFVVLNFYKWVNNEKMIHSIILSISLENIDSYTKKTIDDENMEVIMIYDFILKKFQDIKKIL